MSRTEWGQQKGRKREEETTSKEENIHVVHIWEYVLSRPFKTGISRLTFVSLHFLILPRSQLTYLKFILQIKIKHKRVPLRSSKMNQIWQNILDIQCLFLTNTSAVWIHSLFYFREKFTKYGIVLNYFAGVVDSRLKFVKTFPCIKHVVFGFKCDARERTCAYNTVELLQIDVCFFEAECWIGLGFFIFLNIFLSCLRV